LIAVTSIILLAYQIIEKHDNHLMQSDTLATFKLQHIEDQLSKSELTLKFALRKYQNFHNQLAVRAKKGYDNNQNILSIFVKVASTSFKPIEMILRFIDDADILSLASTSQSLYRYDRTNSDPSTRH
jgi:hypothetical protein